MGESRRRRGRNHCGNGEGETNGPSRTNGRGLTGAGGTTEGRGGVCPAGRNHAEALVGGAPGEGVRSGSRCRRRVRHGLELRGGLVGGRRRGGAGHGPERQQDQDQEETLRVPEGEAVPGLGAAAQRPHVGSQPHGERGPPGAPPARGSGPFIPVTPVPSSPSPGSFPSASAPAPRIGPFPSLPQAAPFPAHPPTLRAPFPP